MFVRQRRRLHYPSQNPIVQFFSLVAEQRFPFLLHEVNFHTARAAAGRLDMTVEYASLTQSLAAYAHQELPFDRLVERVRAKRPELAVRLAFLELMTPDLLRAGEELVASGSDALLIVPIFFGQGGHVREDVPALVEVLRKRWTGVAVSVSRTAGDDSGVVDALASFCVHELDQPRQ